jgi:hypothetical protein
MEFEISNLKLMAEGVSRQLRGWAKSLQDSDIKGQRHLNEKAGRIYHAKQEREEFLVRLREISKPRQ